MNAKSLRGLAFTILLKLILGVLSFPGNSPLGSRGRDVFNRKLMPKEFPCMSKPVKFLFISLLVFAFSAVALGQSTTTGSVGGVVTNPAKEVVSGAAVTVRNVGTNREDTATTDDTGRFKVANLQPGIYAVTVNASGFAPTTNENVVVEVGRETTLEVSLNIGQVTGTVDVSAEAPVINTTQQDFSTNINQTSKIGRARPHARRLLNQPVRDSRVSGQHLELLG